MFRKLSVIFIAMMLLVACGNPATKSTTGDAGESGQQGTKQMTNLETLLQVSKGENGFVFDISFTNKANEDVEVTFPSGQKYEIIVTNEDGEGVYTYSADKTFIAAIENKVIKAGETLTWQEEWDPKANGIVLPAGNYQAEVTMNILTDVEGLLISKDSLIATAEFSLTSEEVEDMGHQEAGAEQGQAGENQEQLVLENNAFRNINVTGKDGKYTVTGEGRVFEAVMNYAVSDGHVYYVEDRYMLPEGAPSWAPFTLEISIPKDKLPVNGMVMLELFEYSAKDGTPINMLFVPLETIGY